MQFYDFPIDAMFSFSCQTLEQIAEVCYADFVGHAVHNCLAENVFDGGATPLSE
jgi:hypothetical protein